MQGERQSSLLEEEDRRLLGLVSSVPFRAAPYTVPAAGNTLVLPPAGRDYGLPDLQALGAVVPNPDGAVELVRHVLVAPGASLRISAPGTVLRLRSDGSGFVSLVAWKATLVLAGGDGAPLTVTSWNAASATPDLTPVDGRAYIRTVRGSMVLDHVHASALGFWSGRTGGVAWTGSPRAGGSGSVTASTFDHGHYGVFASESRDLHVSDSAFLDNEVDGLALHRRAVGTVVTGGRATGNGRHGISADLGSEAVALTGVDASSNNSCGISFSGSPLAAGASAGGAPTGTYGGLTVTGGRAQDNGRAGVRVLEGHGVSITGLAVAGSRDGVVLVRTGSPTNVERTVVRARRFGISVQQGAAGIIGNQVDGGLTGVRLDGARTTVRRNVVRAVTHYGISVSGGSTGSTVKDNILAGRGPAAVDSYRLDPKADVEVAANDATAWTVDRDNWDYWSRFVPRHPTVVLWVVILCLPVLASIWARRRRPALGASPYGDDELRWVPQPVLRFEGTSARRVLEGG